MIFPLRLTPFEEYMLLDDQPAYPMNCFFKIKLRGQFDDAAFVSAIQETLKNHPLLTCSVTETKGRFYWQPTDTMPVIARKPLEENHPFPAAQKIDLFHEPALKMTICHEKPVQANVPLTGQTDIIFEVHHSASDAAGIAQFIEETLCRYAQRKGFAGAHTKNVDPSLLRHRGVAKYRSLRYAAKQFWGIFRAWKFLVNRVIPLTTRKPTEMQKPPAAYPAILCRNLTEEETQHIQQRAKQLEITINDLFLCSAFLAMEQWQEQHLTDRKKGNLRIAVPINLRTPADEQMPAANIVSMVFLDRKPKKIQPVQAFYQGVHREMQHIKRCHLGWAFIRGLTVYRRVFGNFRKMMHPERCWTTATVSNLGKLFADVSLPLREGRVQLDDSLELIGVEACPPVRSLTSLGICMMTYAGCMTINIHYDSGVLTRSDAQSILDMLHNYVIPVLTGMTAHLYQINKGLA